MRLLILLLPLTGALTIMPRLSEAAPIQLQATSVAEEYTNCNTYVVSGSNFSFSSNITGYCSGQGLYGRPGETISTTVGILTAPYPPNTPGQGQTLGSINVPENPGRVAFFTGYFFSPAGTSVTIPNSPPIGTFQLQTTVTLEGTLNACLLPAEAVGGGPCDPNYADFATVNFNLTGIDVFSGSCIDPSTCFFSQTFTATASPVPEPATLGTIVLAAFGAIAGLYLRIRSRSKVLN